MSSSADSEDPVQASSYDGWPPEARVLVEKAVAAHGGWMSWRSVRSIRLGFGMASGFLLAMKGYPRTFGPAREFEVWPHERVVIFHGFPDEQHRGRFVDGDVRIETLDGSLRVESRNHRRTFRGVVKYRRWDPLDALYFFGYALSHYHALPFTLEQARFVSLRRRGTRVVGLEVDFPAGLHTHSQRQCFFFDEEGRIVQHDYVAEVVGWWARACHFWEDYQRVGGLLVARRRRVVTRVFGRPTLLMALRVQFNQVSAQS